MATSTHIIILFISIIRTMRCSLAYYYRVHASSGRRGVPAGSLREQPSEGPREPMPPPAAASPVAAARVATGLNTGASVAANCLRRLLRGQLVPAHGAGAVHLQPRQDALVVEPVLARHLALRAATGDLVQAHGAGGCVSCGTAQLVGNLVSSPLCITTRTK